MESRSLLPGPEIWHFVPNFFLVNLLHPDAMSSVVPGGWSISCEVLFYCMVPFLFLVVTNTKRSIYFVMLTVVFLPIANEVLSVASGSLFSSFDAELVRLYWYRFPLNQLGAFSFGFLLFYVLKGDFVQRYLSDKTLNLSMLLSAGAVCILLSLSKIPFPPKHLVYSACFCLIAVLLSVVPWTLVVNRATVFLGRISYSCYLLHFFVLKEVMSFMASHDMQIANQYLRFAVILVLTFLVTIPLAYVSYRILELPATAAGRSLISRREMVGVKRAENTAGI